MRFTGGLAAALTTLCAVFAIVAPAEGATTRAEYVAQVEPICLAADQAAKSDLKRLNRRFKKKAARSDKPLVDPDEEVEKPTRAEKRRFARAFIRAFATLLGIGNKRFEEATAMIRPIPPAPGDEVAISTWLTGRTESARLLFTAVRAGKHGKLGKFARNAVAASDALNQGQTAVNAFGLNHCFQEPEPGELNLPFPPPFRSLAARR